MTTYRLMDGASGRPGVGSSGTTPPTSPTAYGGTFQSGTIFSPVGQVVWLQGYYWWCPTGGDTGAQKFCLWNSYSTGAQNLVPNSTVTSGTLTANSFNYVALPTPIPLAPGAVYIAATGWTSVNGFPYTANQFASGQPYAAGITNGVLAAPGDTVLGHGGSLNGQWSTYGLTQGLYGTGTAGTNGDPTLNFPASGSDSANFWIDVSVSDTAPGGYAGSYRLRPNMADLGNYNLDTANNFTLGMEFSLSEACTINNVWFYSPATVTQLPTAIGVYQVSGTSLVVSNNSPSWSGAAGSGWMEAALSGTLSAGTNYKVVVLNGAGSPAIWNGYVTAYWSTGAGGSGLTAGPLSFPSNAAATAPGQDSYNAGATMTYPNTSAGPYDYGLDIEVTPAASSCSPRP